MMKIDDAQTALVEELMELCKEASDLIEDSEYGDAMEKLADLNIKLIKALREQGDV